MLTVYVSFSFRHECPRVAKRNLNRQPVRTFITRVGEGIMFSRCVFVITRVGEGIMFSPCVFVITRVGEGIMFSPCVFVITRVGEGIMFSPCVFVITRVGEGIMFSLCVFVSVCLYLSRCLSGQFHHEGLVPHKRYLADTLLGMSSCASSTHSWHHWWRHKVTKKVKFLNGYISVNIWARASIKSSKCRKC